MNYKVIPFKATISSSGSLSDAANQVQAVIDENASAGWEFVSCGNIDTTVEGSSGCFGFGAKPPLNTSILVLIFKK